MTRLVTLVAVVAAFAAPPVLAAVPDELRGAWLAEDIGGGGVVDRVQTTIDIGEGGEVSGSGGCNRVGGLAEVDGDKISFGRMASTMMACPPAVMDQERKFLEALEEVKSWKVDPERRQLILLDGGGKVLVTLARIERGGSIEFVVPGAARVDRVKAAYECGPRKVDVEYINAGGISLAALSIDGEFVVAANVVSGSGARYAGGRYIWWTKGDKATLEDQMNAGAGVVDCVRQG